MEHQTQDEERKQFRRSRSDLGALVGPHYVQATRVVLRFAIVMAVVGLLTGVLYQESSKKLPDAAVDAGVGLEAVLSLSLVHGHILVAAVLLPIGMLGAAFLARVAGGRELSARALKFLSHGYLTFVSGAVLLMLYKGYHTLLAVRGGELDLLKIDAAYFGGNVALRHGVYGVVHVGMFVGLLLFLIALWRSLRATKDAISA